MRRVASTADDRTKGDLEHAFIMPTETGVVASQALIDDIWGEEYREKPYFLTTRISRLKETLQGNPQTQNLVLQEEAGGYSLVLPGDSAN